jgi:hypothetical protein
MTQTALRPNKQSGGSYPKVTEIVTTTLLSIFSGKISLLDGLNYMDDTLRVLLNNAENNGTISTPDTIIPKKNLMKNVGIQFFILIAIVVSVVGSIVIRKNYSPGYSDIPTSFEDAKSPSSPLGRINDYDKIDHAEKGNLTILPNCNDIVDIQKQSRQSVSLKT